MTIGAMVGPEAFTEVRYLDDQRIGRDDRLAHADLAIVDAAERHDRRAGALGAEARKRLRVLAVEERRDGEQFGCRDDALAATAVDSHLEHRAPPSRAT